MRSEGIFKAAVWSFALCTALGAQANTIGIGDSFTETIGVDPDLDAGGIGCGPGRNDACVNFTLASGNAIAVTLGGLVSDGVGTVSSYDARLRDESASTFIPDSGRFNINPTSGGAFSVSGLTAGNSYELRLQIVGDGVTGNGDVEGSVTVAAVPIPAAAWLYGTVLIGFITSAGRKRKPKGAAA